MSNAIGILKIYPESFRANVYTTKPFRMVGLIDVSIEYTYGVERVTLAYFRSSGTNSGKIKGLWYPIVGIKTHSGRFVEFSRYINHVLSITTRDGKAKAGWLAKSLFFVNESDDNSIIRGFSYGIHHQWLLKIGETLRELYENGKFDNIEVIDADYINEIVSLKKVYPGNKHTQRENFEKLIQDIFLGE